MLTDLKWVWLPFSRGHCEALRTELKRIGESGEKCWLLGDVRAHNVLREVVDRIAARAQGLLTVLAIPFSAFAYVFSRDPRVGVLEVTALATLIASLALLFRCMVITWTTPELLADNDTAYRHYFSAMMARIRSFYLGMATAMLTIALLLLQL